MSVNRYQPHVLVLPEDDANRQLANGFLLGLPVINQRIQVLPEVGGWREVLHRFRQDHIRNMERFPGQFMVLLIDFDGQSDRLADVKALIPEHLIDRVFILGVLTQPEALKRALGSYETIGRHIARDCIEATNAIWGHDLLKHNDDEITRLSPRVRPILF